jgi:hypothetical protein
MGLRGKSLFHKTFPARLDESPILSILITNIPFITSTYTSTKSTKFSNIKYTSPNVTRILIGVSKTDLSSIVSS